MAIEIGPLSTGWAKLQEIRRWVRTTSQLPASFPPFSSPLYSKRSPHTLSLFLARSHSHSHSSACPQRYLSYIRESGKFTTAYMKQVCVWMTVDVGVRVWGGLSPSPFLIHILFSSHPSPLLFTTHTHSLLQASEKEYYLATACEEIIAPPSASISLRGFAVSGTFLRGVLDKVGSLIKGWDERMG